MKKTIIYLGLLLTLLVSSAFTAVDEQIQIKPLSDNRYVNMFQVSYSSDVKDTLYVSLVDISGDVIYNEKFVGKSYSKKFSLNIDQDNLSDSITVKLYSTLKNETIVRKFVPSEVLAD